MATHRTSAMHWLWSEVKTAIRTLLTFTLLTGLVYPVAITGIARVLFPSAASGSLIVRDGKPIGSELIGQPFDDPKYFWTRPSATSPAPFNAASSSGSNLAVTNPAHAEAVRSRVERLRAADPDNPAPIPVDLVTTSASGLDPHISPAAAEYQAARVARLRGLSIDDVRRAIANSTHPPQFGVLGNARVNVLRLNLAIDQLSKEIP